MPDEVHEPTEPAPLRRPRWRAMFRAFAHRNYRLFFIGQAVSLVGSWMQQTAMPWLVYDLTRSAFLLGVVSFCAHIPAFFLAPLAGVEADRRDRRRLLLLTQAVAMAQAVILGVLTWAGWIDTWQIIVLALIAGIAGAFNLPAAQAFVADIVEQKEDLASAVALNAAMTNLARVLAPALAGLLITLVGEGSRGEAVCFFLNGASYLALLGVLLLIRTGEPRGVSPRSAPAAGFLASLKEGWVYLFGSVPLRDLLILAALIGLAGTPGTMLALFAHKYDDSAANTFGFLMAATGLGALVGAAYVASRPSIRGSGRRIAVAAALLGAATIGFAYAPSLWLALIGRFVAGFALVVQLTSVTTLVQFIADDAKRGRVLSLFGMAFLGMSPLGNLLTGWLAGATSPETAFLVLGITCAATALWFSCRVPHLRALLQQHHAAPDAHLERP